MITVAKGYHKIEELFRKSDRNYKILIGQGGKPDKYDLHLHDFSEDEFGKSIRLIRENYGINVDFYLTGSICVRDHKVTFENININSSEHDSEILLEGLSIKNLYLTPNIKAVKINNCNIGSVQILGIGVREITLKNSTVGKLQIKKTTHAVKIDISDCFIFQFSMPQDVNIYSFNMHKCVFSCKSVKVQGGDYLMDLPEIDRQAFSNMRNWAEVNKDGKTAHLARGYELAADTHGERGITFTKVMMHLWGFFGNYGLSPLKPLVWFGIFLVAMAILLFQTGTDVTNSSGNFSDIGWMASLQGEGYHAQSLRAAIAALNSAINPFAVFNVRNLVVPDSPLVAMLMPFHGLLSVGLILLSGFSLRRRLKLV